MEENASLEVRWMQGFTDKSFVALIDKKTICYTCASHICFLNLETKMQSVFQTPARDISVLTANCNNGIFAFSEQKTKPSIFVYNFPLFCLKNELKASGQLDYTALALSDGGPYLGCCSLPDQAITVWNWEKAEPVCTQSQSGCDVISLVFSPLNCFQLCALGNTSITVWNIEKSANLHVLKRSEIDLPGTDGSFAKSLVLDSNTDSDKLTKMPPSATLGIKDDKNKLCTEARLTPAAICWTAASELSKLYVGCEQGTLLLVDPKNLSISVQFNATSAELRESKFHGLALCRDGLIAVGKESVVYYLQLKGTQIDIKKRWQIEGLITAVMHSPDNETVLLSSNRGQIYLLKPNESEEITKILDVGSGNFVAAALLLADKEICVSARDSGDLQLWSRDGLLLCSVPLQTQVTCLACCPIAQYAAVGTASGDVLFIDLMKEQEPHLVHQIHLYHCPVDYLVFDQGGHFLLTGASDSHIYVLHTKPSRMFPVIGHTVVPGPILSLSTQCIRDSELVKVLALCAGQEGKNYDGSLLTILSLHVRDFAGPDFAAQNGCLSSDILQASLYEVPHPIQSCVLGVGEIFAYCHQKNSVQQFQLPQDADSASYQNVVQLKPVQEVRGHPLGPACLALSPHHLWLASVGQDGLLCIRETTSMEQCIELQCHSYLGGGVRSMSFSADSQTLLTVGFNNGSIVCANLRIKGMDAYKVKKGTQAMDHHHTGSEGSEAVKIDQAQHAKIKETLREGIKELRATIQEMIRENETIPENERLKDEEFNLDLEEQHRLEAMIKQEVDQVREDIEWEILEKCYLYDVLKKECWDSMKVNRKAIKAFHSELEVINYPLKERTKKEMLELQRVQNIRKIEMATNIMEEEQKGQGAENAAVMGGFSAQLRYSNPYVYDQFSVRTTEQKINQIILLQDVIFHVKTEFDADFEALHKQKVREVHHVKERNKLIREIMMKLDMEMELWEPSLTDREQPEQLFTVDDSEIKAEKYLTPEQKKEEERKKLEAQRHLAAKRDDARERALNDMMGGVLEVKTEDILEKEIAPPEFALTKPANQWDEKEKKAYDEYEKKTKELTEEKEKHKKSLETEMKKLLSVTKDVTERFDVNLKNLFEKKQQCEMAIYQEELKIAYLLESIDVEEEMTEQEQELKSKLKEMMVHKDACLEEVARHEEQVLLFHETYDRIVDEDRILDKDFTKEFHDVPNHMVKQMYKLFKRRPRVQKIMYGSLDPDALDKMLQAMEELDALENRPEGLSPVIWETFCLFRRRKVESEHQVKVNALTLAEMQAVLQSKKDEYDAAEQGIKSLSGKIESLHKEKNHFLTNIMIQVPLKQDQVEVSATDFIPDYTDCVLIHRGVVEDLNKTIRTLGEEKISSMEECKDFRKCIIQLQWEQKKMEMQLEDLNNKARDIRKLKLTEEQQDYLTRKDKESCVSQKVSTLEKNIAFQEKAHQKNIQRPKKRIQLLKRRAAKKAEENAELEKQISELQLRVAERKQIWEAIALEDNDAAKREERYQEILQKKKLEDLARAQAKELALLRAEVHRLRRKNFPSMDQPKHK